MRTARWRAISREQPSFRLGARHRLARSAQPVEIEPGVGEVLIGREPAHALDDDVGGAGASSDAWASRSSEGLRGGGRASWRPHRRPAWPRPAGRRRAPRAKPRKFASTALPSARIAASNASTGTGRRPEAAMAPSITALIMAPAPWRAASMSNSTARAHAPRPRSTSLSGSKRPSPMAIFSAMA